MKEFDLNIGKILENWEIYHAIREIIANALDEQILTHTPEISIYKLGDMWCVRDFGRGLSYHHLMQNENPEKTENDNVIGRFGVGLKDALATLYRHGMRVEVQSKFGTITLKEATKSAFDDIVTLHAQIDDSVDDQMQGTAFCIFGCPDKEIDNARRMFLRFSEERIIEQTTYGQIIAKAQEVACIYINGVKVAEEPNFAFSYNITSLSKQIKKALNRERTNVGRTAYADRIKSILHEAKSDEVIDELCEQLECLSDGTQCDEIKWVDVASHVVKMLNEAEETVFVTPDEIANSSGSTNEILQNSGKRIVFVPASVKKKVEQDADEEITTIQTVVQEYNDSFSYDFVDVNQLTEEELTNWNKVPVLLEKLGLSSWFEKCFISTKLKEDPDNTVGVWDHKLQKIVILRSQLQKESDLFGTVIHEIIHAQTGAADVSRYFEYKLTGWIGDLASRYISTMESKSFVDDLFAYLENKTKQAENSKDSDSFSHHINPDRVALLSIAGEIDWCTDYFGLLNDAVIPNFFAKLFSEEKAQYVKTSYRHQFAVYSESNICYWLCYSCANQEKDDFLLAIPLEAFLDQYGNDSDVNFYGYDETEIALLRSFINSESIAAKCMESMLVAENTWDTYILIYRKIVEIAEVAFRKNNNDTDVWELLELSRTKHGTFDERLDAYLKAHRCPRCGACFTKRDGVCSKCNSNSIR